MSTRQSLGDIFHWKQQCFLCAKPCIPDKKHSDRKNFHLVTTLHFRDKILSFCTTRNDKWGIEVQRRSLDCHDFVAAEARYHKQCYERFYSEKTNDISSPGRPLDQKSLKYFHLVCEWLESEAEIYSISEIHKKMSDIAGSGENIYSQKWLKAKLQQKYKDHIFFVEALGKSDVVCFRNMADYVVNDKWYTSRKENVGEESERIITTAAKLILDDIRSSKFVMESYPKNEDIEDCDKGIEWLPQHLRMFLKAIIKYPLKQASIGQAIVNATRPRSSIPPILFGLGIEMDHVFGSKWLLNELFQLGFCISPTEVTKYKQAVVKWESIDDVIKTYFPGSFTQWSADNIDHNIRSLDGKNTLHAMGIVASTTDNEGNNRYVEMEPVQRQKLKKVGDVTKNKGIKIVSYIPPETSALSQIKLKPIIQLQRPYTLPLDISMDTLWHISLFFRETSRPNWSGFMTENSVGEYPGKSTVTILPVIDLDPTNMSCIYSTLKFVEEQAKALNQKTPVLTFDQLLWLKATEIVTAKSMNIVLILGGFHLMMSFLGSIGMVMNGSGLSEALGTVYGTNAVKHMMTGKAISRSLRGHFLVASALTAKLISKYIPQAYADSLYSEQDEDLPREDDSDIDEYIIENQTLASEPTNQMTEVEMGSIQHLLSTLTDEPESAVIEIASSKEIRKLENIVETYKDDLSSISRTSKLWVQYLHYIELVQLFIRAERTGNWDLHIVSVTKMINLFAATGHIHYAKSARVYVQKMMELPKDYPWLYTKFATNGYHTVRRSDRFWAGLWTDLIIEQVLMRTIKSRGGLTRGRGVNESVRVMWVNSMHRCASVHSAMCNLTGMQHRTSEQHIELGKSRMKQDNEDLKKIMQWFEIHNPFDANDSSLKSLSTGLTVSDKIDVNCDEAEKIGHRIQCSLDGITLEDAKIKRKDKVTTLDCLRPGVQIEKNMVHIDPNILFTRLTAILQNEDDIAAQFSYELTPEPTTLFKDGLMRKSSKSVLRNSFLKKVTPTIDTEADACIIDGGALLHKVKWLPNSSYGDVIEQYVNFVKMRYITKYSLVCVVFDGYVDQFSNKAEEQFRRSGLTSSNIKIKDSMRVTTTREAFLRNSNNKEQLIEELSQHLERSGCNTTKSTGDADVLIVKKGLEYAENKNVVVMADDTDILVLMMYHWTENLKEMFFGTETTEKGHRKSLKYWNIRKLLEVQPLKNYLLFAHAWTGCDTTSATHQKGIYQFLNSILQGIT